MIRTTKNIILTESQIRYCIDRDKIEINPAILEKVNSNFKTYLKEEYRIKTEISKLAQELSDYFFLNYDKQQYKIDKNNVSVAKENKYIKFFGRNILIVCNFYNFPTQELCNKLKIKYNGEGTCKYKKSEIDIGLCFVNWQPLRNEFYASIQHELSHMYDYIVAGDNFESTEEQELYQTIINKLPKTKNILKKQLLRCLYISSKSEQIAHANGLDSQMSSNLVPYYSYQNASEYSYLTDLKSVLDNFEHYNGFGQELLGKSDEWIYNRLSKAYRDYSRRLGRIVTKNML